MVLTFRLDDSGDIEWIDGPNGRVPRLVGTPGEIDAKEKLQSLQIRLKTQLGEQHMHPNTGLDIQGIFSQNLEAGSGLFRVEDIIRANILKTISQDPEFKSPLAYFQIFRIKGTRDYMVELAVKTTEDEIVQVTQRIGVVSSEQGY